MLTSTSPPIANTITTEWATVLNGIQDAPANMPLTSTQLTECTKWTKEGANDEMMLEACWLYPNL